MPISDDEKEKRKKYSQDTLALLAVDNIYPSKAGLELFDAVDRGDMTTEEAKEEIIKRARLYAKKETSMPISSDEKARRSQIIANVRASFSLEGIEPDSEMKALDERYMNGEFADAHELGEVTRAYLRKKYNMPSKSVQDTLASFAVDNIKLSPEGLGRFYAVDRGDMTTEEALEEVRQRAMRYGKGG
jgi:polyhydroxyalkanoate synthesis regulator phasin